MTLHKYNRYEKINVLNYAFLSPVISVGLLYPPDFSPRKYPNNDGQCLKAIGSDIWKSIESNEETASSTT